MKYALYTIVTLFAVSLIFLIKYQKEYSFWLQRTILFALLGGDKRGLPHIKTILEYSDIKISDRRLKKILKSLRRKKMVNASLVRTIYPKQVTEDWSFTLTDRGHQSFLKG